MTINEARQIADDWYLRAGKHPKLMPDGLWRWILPEPGKEDATSELPAEVFNRLRSTQRHPWLFLDRAEAVIMARIAANRAVLKGWKPKECVLD